jgi:hypothetical protein
LGLFKPITKDDVDGWDLTYNENHWSNFDIAKHFAENVMVPNHQVQIELMGLQTHQKLVWLLDCWNVHKSQEFLDWIKEKHPNILVVFVQANCISIL